jgi:uncharacterized protein YjbI with pentapeptide repeats
MKTSTLKRFIICVTAACLMSGLAAGGASAATTDALNKIKTGVCTMPCDLSNASLPGVAVTNAMGADFTKATLTGAKMSGAKLSAANFFGANLTGADLSGTTTFSATTNFTSANLTNVTPPNSWGSAILSGATWIDGVKKCATPSVGKCN